MGSSAKAQGSHRCQPLGMLGPRFAQPPFSIWSALTEERFATWGSRLVWWAQLLGRAGLCPGHRHPAQLNLQAQMTTVPREGSQPQGAPSPDTLATGTKDGAGGALLKARTDWSQRGGVLWADMLRAGGLRGDCHHQKQKS